MEIATAHKAQVAELYRRVLGQRQLVLASNRGPVEYQYTPTDAKRCAVAVVAWLPPSTPSPT